MIEEPFEICCFDGLASPSTLYVPAGTKSKYETTMGWTVFDNIEEMDVTGINGDDVSPTLYNSWVLVSYGNETNEVKKESEGYYYLVTFHTDGRYSGQAYGNEMFGEYQCVGNEMTLSWPEMTQVYYEWADPDEFC